MATKKAPELFYDESRFCGGCGHGIFNRILAEVLEEMDIVSDTIIAPISVVTTSSSSG